MAQRTAHQGESAKQHYVPQFLLRNFSRSDSPDQIHVFDKLRQAMFLSNIGDVASEKNFYDFRIGETRWTIDPAIEREVESPSARVLTKLLESRTLASLNIDDKRQISIFSALQFLRTKHLREIRTQLVNGLGEALRRRGVDDPAALGLEQVSDDELRIESILSLVRSLPKFAPHFLEKAWLLYDTSLDDPFWISDNPVTMQNTLNQSRIVGTLGLAVPGIEIHLPISKTICLCFLCPTVIEYLNQGRGRVPIADELLDAVQNGHCLNLGPEFMLRLNSLQVAFSSRFLYSSLGDFRVAQQMLAANPELKHGPEIGVQ